MSRALLCSSSSPQVRPQLRTIRPANRRTRRFRSRSTAGDAQHRGVPWCPDAGTADRGPDLKLAGPVADLADDRGALAWVEPGNAPGCRRSRSSWTERR